MSIIKVVGGLTWCVTVFYMHRGQRRISKVVFQKFFENENAAVHVLHMYILGKKLEIYGGSQIKVTRLCLLGVYTVTD